MTRRTDYGPVAVAAFALSMLATSLAVATDGSDVTDACYQHAGGISLKTCRSVEQAVNQAGRACRHAAPPEACANLDGRLVSEALVAGFEASWVPRALALQRGLDDDLLLQEELWSHTHNSYNSDAYLVTLSGMNNNQVYSITDQLRMGVRAIEIDVHWAPSADAQPGDLGRAPIACHGISQPAGPATVHIGCTTEAHVRVRLAEVRDWLDANPNEVVMIYLENHLEGSPAAHDRAAEAIEETIGDLVYRPASGGAACDSVPMEDSRADIRASGRRVLLTGNCGPSSAWLGLVHQRGPRWDEAATTPGVTYPDYPACVSAERGPRNYADNWIRTWEDYTWLTAMTGDGRNLDVPPEEARRMVRCGVNMIGFDYLAPFDGKLEALVWSWASDEPASTVEGQCASSGVDGRFASASCGDTLEYACSTPAGAWFVAGPPGPWADGAAACATAGGSFSVPKTGYENELLNDAKGSSEVWLDYSVAAGAWAPEASG